MKKTKRTRGRPSHATELEHEMVLRVAAKAFASKGFDGVKLTDIAIELGVVKSLIHYHYQSKENLWFKTVEWLREKLFEKVQQMSSYFRDLDGIALLKAVNRQYIYFSAEYPEFHKIVTIESGETNERSTWLVNNVLKPMHMILDGVENSNSLKALLKELPVSNILTIVIGAGNIFFAQSSQMKIEFGIDVFDQKEIERHADIVNEIIFHGIIKPT